jgi:hypothetical protein
MIKSVHCGTARCVIPRVGDTEAQNIMKDGYDSALLPYGNAPLEEDKYGQGFYKANKD